LKDTLRGNAPSGQCCLAANGPRPPHLQPPKWVCRAGCGRFQTRSAHSLLPQLTIRRLSAAGVDRYSAANVKRAFRTAAMAQQVIRPGQAEGSSSTAGFPTSQRKTAAKSLDGNELTRLCRILENGCTPGISINALWHLLITWRQRKGGGLQQCPGSQRLERSSTFPGERIIKEGKGQKNRSRGMKIPD